MGTPIYGVIPDDIATKYPGMTIDQILQEMKKETEKAVEEKENLKKQMEYSKGEGVRSRYRITEEGSRLWNEKRTAAKEAWLERLFESSSEYKTFISWYTKKAQEKFNDFSQEEPLVEATVETHDIDEVQKPNPNDKVQAPPNAKELLNAKASPLEVNLDNKKSF